MKVLQFFGQNIKRNRTTEPIRPVTIKKGMQFGFEAGKLPVTFMKRKIAITTDSAADISRPMAKEYDIHVIPMVILSAEKQFKDGIDITAGEMLSGCKESKTAAKAAPVSAQEYKLVFSSLVEKGYDVIHISPSSKLFPCYENACFAANAFSNVTVVDSRSVSAGLLLLCLEASRMRLEEKQPDEIAAGIRALVPQIDTSFLVKDPSLLFKSGICTAPENIGARLFGFYPCIGLSDGAITVEKKYRGELDGARKKYLDEKLASLGESGSESLILTACGLGQEEIDRLCDYIKETSCAECVVTEAGCCPASYCSDGFIGLAFKKRI